MEAKTNAEVLGGLNLNIDCGDSGVNARFPWLFYSFSLVAAQDRAIRKMNPHYLDVPCQQYWRCIGSTECEHLICVPRTTFTSFSPYCLSCVTFHPFVSLSLSPHKSRRLTSKLTGFRLSYTNKRTSSFYLWCRGNPAVSSISPGAV